jgi:hypothetical protein
MIEARLLFGSDTVDIQLPDRAQVVGGGDGPAAAPPGAGPDQRRRA